MTPYFEREGITLFHGDCREVLCEMADASVDSCVTDPPYELGFMGKAWDASGIANSVDLWREVLRVMKPGGHLLAFGGTRTYHRMACAIEDAGFEIRDSLHWMYGTGFPKSLNIGDGRGTALKPAHEPIILARKPIVGTVAANVLAFGTGALNIDGARLSPEGNITFARQAGERDRTNWRTGGAVPGSCSPSSVGRWPANILFAHLPDCTDTDCAPGCAVAELDRQSGTLKSGTGAIKRLSAAGSRGNALGSESRPAGTEMQCYGDSGGASRFFYVSKPSRSERDAGCEHLPVRSGGEATDREDGSSGTQSPRAGAGRTGSARNIHPTVKPIDLMRYLVRLVTPPGGLVLDPFTGSGTTACAAALEGLRFVGSEMTADYLPIIEARVTHWAAERDGQLDLFGRGVA